MVVKRYAQIIGVVLILIGIVGLVLQLWLPPLSFPEGTGSSSPSRT
jgi:hypothetical protein